MNITREGDDLVLRLPLYQKSYDALGEYVCETANLIGVCAGDDFTISQLIDLGYKGSQQEGMPIISFATKEEGMKVCKELDIDVWEHSVCTFPGCRAILRGVHTLGKNGVECCEHSA